MCVNTSSVRERSCSADRAGVSEEHATRLQCVFYWPVTHAFRLWVHMGGGGGAWHENDTKHTFQRSLIFLFFFQRGDAWATNRITSGGNWLQWVRRYHQRGCYGDTQWRGFPSCTTTRLWNGSSPNITPPSLLCFLLSIIRLIPAQPSSLRLKNSGKMWTGVRTCTRTHVCAQRDMWGGSRNPSMPALTSNTAQINHPRLSFTNPD